jgi:hypothetical protein
MSDFYDREHLEVINMITANCWKFYFDCSSNHQFRIDEYANIIISKKQ